MLVASIVVFLFATQLGGGDDRRAAVLPSPAATAAPAATRAPAATAAPSADPSPTPQPKRRFYRVKPGDSLSGIAAKFSVKEQQRTVFA